MNKPPTLTELRNVGYVIDVKHTRNHRVAFVNPTNGKLVVKVVTGHTNLIPPAKDGIEDASMVLGEMLPKGGLTEVWVTDPETSAEFYGFAKCHEKENYNKKTGVLKALERVWDLMLVMDGREGFNKRLP